MKKKFGLALLLLLCLALLAACSPKETEQDQPGEDQQGGEEIKTVENLTVEMAPGDSTSEALLSLQEQLPALLQNALQEKGYTVSSVTVSFSSSAANTLTAVGSGSVSLGWVETEAYISQNQQDVTAVLGSTLDRFGTNVCSLICTAPTQTGLLLREIGASSQTITWEDLSIAAWGVVDPAVNDSYHYTNVWLAENFGGKTLADLPHVTSYESPIELLRAASKGEVAVLSLLNDDRTTYAELWTLGSDQSNADGVLGFGRGAHISDEVKVLQKSSPFYPYVVVAQSGSAAAQEDFVKALASAMNTLVSGNMELFPAYQRNKLVTVDADKLAPQRLMVEKQY